MRLCLLAPPPPPPCLRFPNHKPARFQSTTTLNLPKPSLQCLVAPKIQSHSSTGFGTVSVAPPPLFPLPKFSPAQQASFLITFIVCTASVSFTSLVIAAVPTITAMGRVAISLSKLADTAREELPSTMAAVRLSVMEISDLTLELNDLSHEIADGFSKSAQAVQAAETGIKQIGSIARQQTMSMIQERASLPPISIQPIVAGAAKKTSRAVSQATKSIVNMISRGENTEGDGNTINKIGT